VLQMDKIKEEQIRYDRELSGSSYRTLGKKYGVHFTTVRRILMSKNKQQEVKEALMPEEEPMPEDTASLQEELRKARLMIGLQAAIIDIASKELGFDIRKKRGTRRSGQ
jgi:hypothetical protein